MVTLPKTNSKELPPKKEAAASSPLCRHFSGAISCFRERKIHIYTIVLRVNIRILGNTSKICSSNLKTSNHLVLCFEVIKRICGKWELTVPWRFQKNQDVLATAGWTNKNDSPFFVGKTYKGVSKRTRWKGWILLMKFTLLFFFGGGVRIPLPQSWKKCWRWFQIIVEVKVLAGAWKGAIWSWGYLTLLHKMELRSYPQIAGATRPTCSRWPWAITWCSTKTGTTRFCCQMHSRNTFRYWMAAPLRLKWPLRRAYTMLMTNCAPRSGHARGARFGWGHCPSGGWVAPANRAHGLSMLLLPPPGPSCKGSMQPGFEGQFGTLPESANLCELLRFFWILEI